MEITLGQQYIMPGRSPPVILYIYVNHHAGTPEKQRKQNVAFRRKALFVNGVSEFVKVAGM